MILYRIFYYSLNSLRIYSLVLSNSKILLFFLELCYQIIEKQRIIAHSKDVYFT